MAQGNWPGQVQNPAVPTWEPDNTATPPWLIPQAEVIHRLQCLKPRSDLELAAPQTVPQVPPQPQAPPQAPQLLPPQAPPQPQAPQQFWQIQQDVQTFPAQQPVPQWAAQPTMQVASPQIPHPMHFDQSAWNPLPPQSCGTVALPQLPLLPPLPPAPGLPQPLCIVCNGNYALNGSQYCGPCSSGQQQATQTPQAVCMQCQQRACFPGHPFCSVECAQAAQQHGNAAGGVFVQLGQLNGVCAQCRSRPAVPGNLYCGRGCAIEAITAGTSNYMWPPPQAAVIPGSGFCNHCHAKPCWPGFNYCSKTCGAQAQQANSTQAQPGGGPLCQQCQAKPVFPGFAYCSKKCGLLANNKPCTKCGAPCRGALCDTCAAAAPKCSHCKLKPAQVGHPYCSRVCAAADKAAQELCPVCSKQPCSPGYSFCSKACGQAAGNDPDYVPFDKFKKQIQQLWDQTKTGKKIKSIDENPHAKPGGALYKQWVAGRKKLTNPTITPAFHGTAVAAVPLICQQGFDPTKRSGQAYGPGEYFGADPSISLGYCKGGDKMLACQLSWDSSNHTVHGNIIVMKNPVDDLPRAIITFA
eukprot:TRINITY_DN94089_c0_g1_i1.p1 TRINITY_DN94089_c0_g1~~TRINITY_DN94089_c0_g1_i1.p1  ORF type:complete len:586 (-),score=63.71 TRINITY_DN94089_c0_g1_i1:39-1775(-)